MAAWSVKTLTRRSKLRLPDVGFCTVVNPRVVDEQVRGGVVQGLGAALFEKCEYDARGQLLNGNMADYLVPMAAEMPDIEVGHVVSPTADSELGAKGGGRGRDGERDRGGGECRERCAAGAGAAAITEVPITPEGVLRALGK
jgi:molybdopterin-binding aldehyde dehydrogenase-like protein